jgi:hypothetical protein
MKKNLLSTFFLLVPGILLLAQEKVKMDVTVTEDGKVTCEKTYEFKDAQSAKTTLKTLELLSETEKNAIVKGTKGEADDHKMIVISEDGTITRHMATDDLEWIEEKTLEDGSTVKVIKMKKTMGEEPSEGEEVVVKEEIIIVSGEEGEDADWTIKKLGEDENVEVIVIKKKMEKDGEVKVEVEVEQEKPVKKEKVERKK